jgi:hypothetical protein
MGFGLVIRFIGHLQSGLHAAKMTVTTAHVKSGGFKWQMFPFLWVSELFLVSVTSFSILTAVALN